MSAVLKVCSECRAEKPVSDYYRNKGGRLGVHARCKPCFIRRLADHSRYAEKTASRRAVTNAIKYGRLTRPDACSHCGVIARVHGHHDDYSKPLDVRWLCNPCHQDHHRGETYESHAVPS